MYRNNFRLFFLLFSLSLLFVPLVCECADLLQVYRDALKHDAQFKAAKANWLMVRESVPLARSRLLPHIHLSAYVDHTEVRSELGSDTNISSIVGSNSPHLQSSSHPHGYAASLSQPLFNLAAWFDVREAQALAKQAQADYLASAQAMLYRVADRYFAVLKAKDVLRFVRAEKKATYRAYKRALSRYKIGVSAVTAFKEAKARYDVMVADEIRAENAVANQVERLREITQHTYASFSVVDKHLPLVSPNPKYIDAWVQATIKHNYALWGLRMGLKAAKAHIRQQYAGHAPMLNASASVTLDQGRDTSTIGASNIETRQAGLALTLPLFEGGQVVAQTHKAQYRYQKLSDEYNYALQNAVSDTRQSYLNINAAIKTIQADAKVIDSMRSALRATLASYKAGKRTMNDVLESRANLYEAQKNYMGSVYDYILENLKLKHMTGRLGAGDLVIINGWLHGPR